MKILGLLLILVVAVNAKAGREGNGGDVIAEEFQDLQKITSKIIALNGAKFPTVPLEKLRTVSDSLLVFSQKSLRLDGFDKDAINYSKKNLVLVNRTTWPGLSEEKKYLLVAHELMGLLELPDQNYRISEAVKGLIPNAQEKSLIKAADWESLLSYNNALKVDLNCQMYIENTLIPEWTFHRHPLYSGVFEGIRMGGVLITLKVNTHTNVLDVEDERIIPDHKSIWRFSKTTSIATIPLQSKFQIPLLPLKLDINITRDATIKCRFKN